jgi:hypothetical protein
VSGWGSEQLSSYSATPGIQVPSHSLRWEWLSLRVST